VPAQYYPIGSHRARASLWGHTCDGFDCIAPDMLRPASIAPGDWLVWDNMGAYTAAASSEFNGFQRARRIVIPADAPQDIEVFVPSDADWEPWGEDNSV
jgi:diaminopimelate decarboxylase